jgi:predicted nucleotidyltransferase component of viral defense system
VLFAHALRLMDHLEAVTQQPRWSFGGGTALMLRIAHRHSKDIDIFVPDPQYLGYVNPRLSDAAEAISTDYEESALYIKLFLEAGEIDVIVGTQLTERGFEAVPFDGRELRVETSAEILAKKMWHRGDRAKARDLFDLCAVAIHEPEAIEEARPHFHRHAAAFLQRLISNREIVQREFDAIDRIGDAPTFDECLEIARSILAPEADTRRSSC